MILIMMGLGFPHEKKILGRMKRKTCFNYENVFYYENKLTFPIPISDHESENSMDLLLVIDESKSGYVYINDFVRFMFHKTKKKYIYIFLQKLFAVF